MAHKTLIDGTAYEISGGTTLVDGTGYSIAKGKTLIGGTAYDIRFTPIGPLISVVSTKYVEAYKSYAYVSFTDAKGRSIYVDSTGIARGNSANGNPLGENLTFEIPLGTVITCYVQGGRLGQATIALFDRIGGVSELDSVKNGSTTVEYVVSGNATIIVLSGGASMRAYGEIHIQET